jgi:hypothetical protein
MIKEKNEMGRTCSTYRIVLYRDLVEEAEGKILLKKSRRRW